MIFQIKIGEIDAELQYFIQLPDAQELTLDAVEEFWLRLLLQEPEYLHDELVKGLMALRQVKKGFHLPIGENCLGSHHIATIEDVSYGVTVQQITVYTQRGEVAEV